MKTNRSTAILSRKGTDREALIQGLQQKIIEGKLKGVSRGTRIARLHIGDMGKPNEFAAKLNPLFELIKDKKLQSPGSIPITTPEDIIFYIDEDDIIKFAQKQNAADNLQWSDYIAVLREKFGPKVRVIVAAGAKDQDAMREAYPFLKAENWSVRTLIEFTPEQVMATLRQTADEFTAKTKFTISDDTLKFIDKRCRQYYPEYAQPGCGARLIEAAIARKEQTLEESKPAELATEMRQELAELTAEYDEMKPFTGKYARERVAEIPTRVQELNQQIELTEAHAFRLARVAEAIKGTDSKTLRENLERKRAVLVAELKLHPEKAAEISKQADQLNEEVKDLDELNELNINDVAMEIHNTKRVSFTEILTSQTDLKWEEFEAKFRKDYVGAETVLRVLKQIFYAGKIRGAKGPDEPEYSLLLIGDAGAGKTYFAETLAKYLKDGNLVKLAGGTMTQPHQISLIFGAPPGYLGYDAGSSVINDLVRYKGRVIFLFDEIDKVHTEIRNGGMLEAVEKGVLIDGKGLKASLRDAVAIDTANFGEDVPELDAMTEQELREWLVKNGKVNPQTGQFEPYLTRAKARRYDKVVLFRKFKAELRGNMIMDMFRKESEAFGKQTGIGFRIDEDVLAWIGSKVPANSFNANEIEGPLRENLISRIRELLVENNYMLKGKLINLAPKKGEMVKVTMDDGELVFNIDP